MYSVDKKYYPYDVAISFIIDFAPHYVHKYLNLCGVYKESRSRFVFTSEGNKYEMDGLFLVGEDNIVLFTDALIDLEHQSYPVGDEKAMTIVNYCLNTAVRYNLPVIPVILTDYDSYIKSRKEFKYGPSLNLKPFYYYRTLDEIWKIIYSLEDKNRNNEILSDEDSLNIAILPVISPKNKGREITRRFIDIYLNSRIEDELLRLFAVFSLSMRVNNYFEPAEQLKLYEELNMEANISCFEKVADEEIVFQYRELVSEHNQVISERDDAKERAVKAQEKAKHYEDIISHLKESGKITEDDIESFDFKE